jgi:hypothetical protein
MPPLPHRDFLEIRYAAKLGTLLNRGWEINGVLRYGTFRRNTLLADAEIVEELCGGNGATGQRFKRRISVANKAQVSSARADLANCLESNPPWRASISRHFDEIEREFPQGQVEISLFGPSAGLITLFLIATRLDFMLYLPIYALTVAEGPDVKRVYFGSLKRQGDAQTLDRLLMKYYEGNIERLLVTLLWGGHESRDAEILEDCGLVYRSYRRDIVSGEEAYFSFRDERWTRCAPFNPIDEIQTYMQAQMPFIETLIEQISSRWDGGLVNLSG